MDNTISLQRQHQADRLRALAGSGAMAMGITSALDRYWHRAQSLASSEGSNDDLATSPETSTLRGRSVIEGQSFVISPSSVVPSPPPRPLGSPIPFFDDAAFQLWLASRAGPNYPVLPREGSVRREDPIGRKRLAEEKERRRLKRAQARKEKEKTNLGIEFGAPNPPASRRGSKGSGSESDAVVLSTQLRQDLKITPNQGVKAKTEAQRAKDMKRREERAEMEAGAARALLQPGLPRIHFTRGTTRFVASPSVIQDSGPVSVLTEGESQPPGFLEETEATSEIEVSPVVVSKSPQSPVTSGSHKASEVCTPTSAAAMKPQETSTPRDESFLTAPSSLASTSAGSKLPPKTCDS